MNLASFLLQVKAIDSDEGDNGRVEYRLVGGNKLGHFTIHPRLGSLIVVAELDRETVSREQCSLLT